MPHDVTPVNGNGGGGVSPECDRLREELKRIERDIQREKAGANNQQVLDLLEQEFNGAFKEFRERGCDALPPPPPFVVHWEQADSLSILIDAGQNAWNAGHVNDVLIITGGGDAGAILAASDSGGIWLLQQPDSRDRPLARPLSDHWGLPSVNIKCLAAGPDGTNHVYAGTNSGFVFEANPSAPFPLDSWRDISAGTLFGNVYRIVVLPKPRRIVVACAKGLRWAEIPSPGGAYKWQEPLNFPRELCSDVVLSSNDSLVIAKPISGSFSPFTTGLFRGHWTSAGLEMELKPLPSSSDSLFSTEALMGITSLASCTSNLNRIYALLEETGKGAILAVFRSDDGGDSWTGCSLTVQIGGEEKSLREIAGMGNPEGYNNCIGVSPINPDFVTIGFRRGEPIVSDSGGTNPWFLPADQTKSAHLHSDLHAFRFDSTGKRFYVCSDGGVVATDDSGRTYQSLYNRELLNLQFYGETHEQSGAFSASSEVDGLIAGGTQDNGNIYTVIGPNAIAWTNIEGGDGGRNLLVGPGRLLRCYNTEQHIRAAHWVPNELVPDVGSSCTYKDGDGVTQQPDSVVPVTAPKPSTTTDGCGLVNALMVEIRTPQYSRRWRDMIALAAIGTDVYGLFPNLVLCFMQSRRPLLHWDYLGSIDSGFGDISALASVDGNGIFIGTTRGAMFAMTAPQFIANQISVSYPEFPDPSFKPTIKRIAVQSGFEAFAIYNTEEIVGGTRGHVLRFTGHNWFEVVATDLFPISRLNSFANPLIALEADWTTSPLTLFACTDLAVFMSDNLGQTWHSASKGLPERPFCTDLRFVRHDDGSHYLYLSTYGRSLWRARMNRRPF